MACFRSNRERERLGNSFTREKVLSDVLHGVTFNVGQSVVKKRQKERGKGGNGEGEEVEGDQSLTVFLLS